MYLKVWFLMGTNACLFLKKFSQCTDGMSCFGEQSCNCLPLEVLSLIVSNGFGLLATTECSKHVCWRSKGQLLVLESSPMRQMSGQKGQTAFNKQTSISSHFVNKAVHTYHSSGDYTFLEWVILICCRSGFAHDLWDCSVETAAPVNVRGKQLLFAHDGTRYKAKEAGFVSFSTKADLWGGTS